MLQSSCAAAEAASDLEAVHKETQEAVTSLRWSSQKLAVLSTNAKKEVCELGSKSKSLLDAGEALRKHPHMWRSELMQLNQVLQDLQDGITAVRDGEPGLFVSCEFAARREYTRASHPQPAQC